MSVLWEAERAQRKTLEGGDGKCRVKVSKVMDERALITVATESPASAVRATATAARPAVGPVSASPDKHTCIHQQSDP